MTSRLSSTRIKLEECKSWRRVACTTRLDPFPSSPPPPPIPIPIYHFPRRLDHVSLFFPPSPPPPIFFFFFSIDTKRISCHNFVGKHLPSIHVSLKTLLVSKIRLESLFSFPSPSPIPHRRNEAERRSCWQAGRTWVVVNNQRVLLIEGNTRAYARFHELDPIARTFNRSSHRSSIRFRAAGMQLGYSTTVSPPLLSLARVNNGCIPSHRKSIELIQQNRVEGNVLFSSCPCYARARTRTRANVRVFQDS